MADVSIRDSGDGWVHDADAKRRAWAAMTPTQRWQWLVDAIDLAQATGALAKDRRRRAAAARTWAPDEDLTADRPIRDTSSGAARR